MKAHLSKVFLFISMILRCTLCVFLALPLVIGLKIGDWFYARSWGEHLFHAMLFRLYQVGLWCSWVPVRYQGMQNIIPAPAIIVANHQSALDIPLVGILTRGAPQLWFAKSELETDGNTIFLRWILARIAILVDLDQPMARIKTMLRAIRTAEDHGAYVIIFPEGSRYTDGQVHEFFGGFATLARKTSVPVIPVHIKGAAEVLPPDSMLVRTDCPVTVTIGAPMTPSEEEDDDAFKQRVWKWFIAQ